MEKPFPLHVRNFRNYAKRCVKATSYSFSGRTRAAAREEVVISSGRTFAHGDSGKGVSGHVFRFIGRRRDIVFDPHAAVRL